MAPAARSAALAAAFLGLLALLRPGFVVQSAGSPLAWLTLLGVLLLVVGIRLVVPRAATAASLVVALAATVLLVAPSFRQRTLNEPLPPALQQAVAAALPSAAPAPVTPLAESLTSPSPAPVAPASAAPGAVRTAAPAAARPAPTTAAPDRPSSAPAPQQQLTAELQGIDHRASGRMVLYPDQRVVRFQKVDIEGSVGPSVHLVPAGKRRPDGGVRLGALKAERGSFFYTVPASVDLRRGWTVLVWCDPYDVPIAAADPT